MHVRPRALIAALACLPLGLPTIRAAVGHALLPGHAAQVKQDFVDPNASAAGPTIYVSNSGNDSNSGTTLATAKKTIQAGIDAVAAGGTVYVEPGTYTGAGNHDLNPPSGITVRDDPANNGNAANTIINISGTSSANATGFRLESKQTAATLIFGFTIENGNESTSSGGAVVIGVGANPTIQNCVFSGNQSQFGGAIYITDSAPTIRECTFTNNQAIGPASAFPVGGAIEIFFDNGVPSGTYTPIITNCVFTGNTAPTDGAAIDVSNGNAGVTLSPAITNCTFTQNTSVYQDANDPGGTIGVFSANPTITNCILYADTVMSGGNGGEITVVPPNGAPAAVITTNDDDIQQNGITGTNDTNQNPDFVGAASGFSSPEDLANVSPEIGAGTANVPTTLTTGVPPIDLSIDRNGNPRNGRIDDGAFENPDTPPTANAQSVTVPPNTAKTVTLTGTDPSGRTLTYAVATNPAHGVLSGTAPNLTYTPNAGFQGADSFTFTVSTLSGVSSPTAATVSLQVAAPPTANAQTVPVLHNTAKAITLTGSDPNSPALSLTYAVTANPSHGTLGTLNASTGAVTYTPANDYHGSDTFQFTVTNTAGLTSTAATVTLNVAAGTPTANAQTVNVAFNTAKGITLTGSDSDVPTLGLTYAVGTGPSHGTLGTLNASTGAVTYTPAANYHGSDSFTFTVSNGTNTSTAATVTLNVATGTPTANGQTVSVAFNAATAVTLTATDPDSPALGLTYTVATNPTHGMLTGTAPNLTYTPTTGYHGSDSFTFTASNGTNASSPATVTLNVATGTPTASGQTVNVAFNTAKAFNLSGGDPDVPPLALTYAVGTGPSHGSLSGFNAGTGAVTYTPTTGYQGADSFTFTVSNGANTSTAATVTLNVAAGVPTASPQSVTTNENTAKAITLTGSDPDVPPLSLTYTIGTGPAHGMLSGTAPNLTYTPNAGYVGPDTFNFTVNNGTNTSPPAIVSLTVSQVAATVTAASVSWGTAGTAALQTNADGLRLLPAGRNTDLPWLGISQIGITLSLPATLSPGDVTVTGINVANYGPVTVAGSGTSYTLTLAQPIGGADRVTLTLGNAALSTYTRRLDVLPGDVNDDGAVTIQDAVLIRNMFLGIGGATPTLFGDINGDGIVDVTDYNLVRQKIGSHLP